MTPLPPVFGRTNLKFRENVTAIAEILIANLAKIFLACAQDLQLAAYSTGCVVRIGNLIVWG
jgi:hypothetical protein